jgi:hypothetical protein
VEAGAVFATVVGAWEAICAEAVVILTASRIVVRSRCLITCLTFDAIKKGRDFLSPV